MYYGKDVFVCESKSGVLVSGKRIFRLLKKFGDCTVNLSNWYSGWISYNRYVSQIFTESGSSYKKRGKNYIRHISAVSHLELAR